jgi:hypothetical protein
MKYLQRHELAVDVGVVVVVAVVVHAVLHADELDRRDVACMGLGQVWVRFRVGGNSGGT